MEYVIFQILTGIGFLFLSIYYYLFSKFDYWKNRHVQGPQPIPIFGNYKDILLGRKYDAVLFKEFYEEFKNQPLIGIYSRSKPKLIIKDLDLIKDVLIRDFNVFADRGIKLHEKAEAFCLHLFNLEHERWKPLRSKLSPIFTSGKLKEMFYLIADCGDHFQKYLEVLADKSDSIDGHELTAKFTTDSIGVCAFGFNMNAIGETNSEFRNFGRSIFEPTFKNKAKRWVKVASPALYNLIGGYLQPSAEAFFERCIKETVAYRRANNVRRNDFIDLLIDLKNNPDKIQNFELTDRLFISQVYLFFIAGFETSATTMSHTLYQLALNQHIQDKLRKEIHEELAKSDGKLTYDGIKNMKYLGQVVKETLRKYPPASTLVRYSLAPYTFNGTKVTIPKGIPILIPIWSIQRDPEIYPNPEVYDPERFNDENIKTRHPMAFLSFGEGPRICIGSRFANYQVKVGIISIIQKFKVEPCAKTYSEYRLVPQSPVPMPVAGIHVKLTKI